MAEATTSASVSVTVDNAPPTTAVLIPSTGTTQSGTAALLDASASIHVTAVTFELNGNGLTNQVIATGTPTRSATSPSGRPPWYPTAPTHSKVSLPMPVA